MRVVARLQLVVLLTLSLFLVACERSPFARLNPTGTTWIVSGITGADMPAERPVIVSFDGAGGYTITSPCQIVKGDLWIDTDGYGFGFFHPSIRMTECNDPGSDEAAISTLLAVERWEVVGDDRIRLIGPGNVDLSRRN